MNATQHDASGFNLDLGKTWIYPTNLSVRKYQKDIVEEALFKNTMVCLPTGLGKTLIAAVVMYNFYRWYPSGKVIFMATTKPLVKQQVDACYRIVAMPKESTAELTGSVVKQNRQSIWRDKRVFFLTPQVLRNDLDTVANLGSKIKCIVIDEAHRARGNHAYCEVINRLLELNKEFRVLALTATPASNILEVINVCKQLLIAHLEVRTEDSPDVVPYSHQKSIQTIVLKLDGKLLEVINEYKKILDKYVRILVENKVIHSNFASLHKGRLFYLSKEYQEKNTHNRSTEKYKLINKAFATCTILYHAYDLLLRHGLRSFLMFFEENIDKPLLVGSATEIRELMESIKQYVGPSLTCDKLPDGTHLKLPDACKFGHPKFYKLREILSQHFTSTSASTSTSKEAQSKVIIFCEYKDSVAEAYAALLDEPFVKPKMFMGQSSIAQKQQISIIESFRSGSCNTLISTCIGEEGIDVGFVDLVICFDISNKSSVRFIQRIGRTGRDRNGKVVILVSEGREQQVLKECLREKEHLCDTLVHAKNIDEKLYQDSPRMIPEGLTPECQEIFIAPKKPPVSTLKSFLIPSTPSTSALTLDTTAFTNFLPKTKSLFMNNVTEDTECFKFNKHLSTQRRILSVTIPTSLNAQILVDVMNHVEYARYNIQKSTILENKQTLKATKSTKQTDIRNLFKQCSQSTKTVPEEQSNGLEMLVDAKIAHIMANKQDCNLCDLYDNDTILNLKRDLVPIGTLNLNIDLRLDLIEITTLQAKINARLNKVTKKSETIEVLQTPVKDLQESTRTSESIFDDLVAGSPLQSVTQDNNTVRKSIVESPDLFAEDSPPPQPERVETPKVQQVQETVVVGDDDDEIIEGSPLPVITKRKSSQSSDTRRARKRIKFDFTDIFDTMVTSSVDSRQSSSAGLNKTPESSQSNKNKSLGSVKPKIQLSDIFDIEFSKPKTAVKSPEVPGPSKSPIKPISVPSSSDFLSHSDVFIAPTRKPLRMKKQMSCVDIIDMTFLRSKSSESRESQESLESHQSHTDRESGSSLSSIECIADNEPKKSKSRARQFIDSEAEVSSDELHSNDEFIATQDDVYERSFVDDGDASIAPCTQTHAMYLQSVRSPVVRGKPLTRPAARHVDDTQVNETVDLTYAKDSFCVDDDSDAFDAEETLDELERAELALKRRRRLKGQASEVKVKERRKRVRRIESYSD